MNLIASADLDWGIGYQGQLLFRTHADMQYVKQHTTGKVIVMGRNTFLSLPGKKPLPNRTNIVLSEVDDFARDDIVVCLSLDDLLQTIKQYPPQDVYVFGGQNVYTQLLPYCDTAYITQFDAQCPHDASLPRLDQDPAWYLASRSDPVAEGDLHFTFDVYRRRPQDG